MRIGTNRSDNEQLLAHGAEIGQRLTNSLGKVIKGRLDTIELVITALLADGHVLLEDYPGSGKTTLTKALGGLIGPDEDGPLVDIAPFRRIQFTPDMLPGDVLGVTIFDRDSNRFRFVRGPVFAHIVLADEINRTGPKVQAAFLECMAEKQVTIDNVTHHLDDLFFVAGTQNPLDVAGTYPLPLVQLDRFLLKVPMAYVDAATEYQILENHQEIIAILNTLEPVCTRAEVLLARAAATTVFIGEPLRRTIVRIIQASRRTPEIEFGVSTRAGLMLQSAMRGRALLAGRAHCTEDDLLELYAPVLLHRLRFRGLNHSPAKVLEQLVAPELESLIRSTI